MSRLWPSMTDYSGAIQNAQNSFRLRGLADAQFATLPPMGLPAFASGQNAVVFSATLGTTSTAVRCFTTPSADGRRRYQALERQLREHPVEAMASAQWIDDAIEVNGGVWPIVTMEWVDGQQLHEYIESNVYDEAILSRLADAWLTTCATLRASGVTHGDLQHGNVLVDERGAVRLIDFDGVWVHEINDSPPAEVGHPNYQHPARSETGAWGWSIDWFSALGVLVSIRAVAAEPSLWNHHNGENLVLLDTDYWGDAEIWRLLEGSPDPDVVAWSRLLAEGCAHKCDAPFDLPTILTKGLTPVDGPGREADPASAPRQNVRPTSPKPDEDNGSVGGAWWAVAAESTVDSEPELLSPLKAVQTPFVPTAEVNASWVTGASTAPPAPGPGTGSSTGVRPPDRARPEEQEVRSSWKEPGAAGQTGGTPSGPASVSPPGARYSGPPQQGRFGQEGRPVWSSSHRESNVRVLGYVLLVVVFVVIGVMIGVVAGRN